MTVKNYGLAATASELEIGKRRERLRSEGNGVISILKNDGSLGSLNVSVAKQPDQPATLSQLDGLTVEGAITGTASSDSSGNVTITTTFNGSLDGKINKYNVVNSSVSLSIDGKYYIVGSNNTLTLPDTTTLSVGDAIIIRSKGNTSNTLNVYDSNNEIITTTAGTTTTIVLDIMEENSLVYAGSGEWEML